MFSTKIIVQQMFFLFILVKLDLPQSPGVFQNDTQVDLVRTRIHLLAKKGHLKFYHSLKLTAKALENRPRAPKMKVASEPPFFRGKNVSFREGKPPGNRGDLARNHLQKSQQNHLKGPG